MSEKYEYKILDLAASDEHLEIEIKAPEPDLSPPAHLVALSILFCPLCNFRFVRPWANIVSVMTDGYPGYPFWMSFYRCPLCSLYFAEFRCVDSHLDSMTRNRILAFGKMPPSRYSQEKVEENNRSVITQIAESLEKNR